MHSTQCAIEQFRLMVHFCLREGTWHAIAYDVPGEMLRRLADHLSEELPLDGVEVEEIDYVLAWSIAVSATGETAGQATMAASVLYEQERARREFEYKSAGAQRGDRWMSRPAPRRTPPADTGCVFGGSLCADCLPAGQCGPAPSLTD